MARNASCICGAVPDIVDPAAVGYNPLWNRSTLIFPTCVMQGPPPLPTGSFIYPWQDTIKYLWRVNLVSYNFALVSTPVGGGSPTNITASGTVPAMANNASADENGLICLGAAQTQITSPPPGGQITLASYDLTTTDFTFNVDFPTFTRSASGLVSAAVMTVLGQNVLLYDSPTQTYTGTIDIAISSYWAYDNGLSLLSTDGPVWDTTTGAALISPTPITLFSYA